MSIKLHVYEKTTKTQLNTAQLVETTIGALWNVFQVLVPCFTIHVTYVSLFSRLEVTVLEFDIN